MPPTVFRSSAPRAGWAFVGSVAFVAVGVWIIAKGDSLLAGVLTVLFFGYCAVVLAGRALRRHPELVVDDEGLEHIAHGRVSWERVDHVTGGRVTAGGMRFDHLKVVLRDPSDHPPTESVKAAVSRVVGPPSFTIAATTLPVSLDDVLAAMLRHHPDLVVR